jgi:hypothetical protein
MRAAESSETLVHIYTVTRSPSWRIIIIISTAVKFWYLTFYKLLSAKWRIDAAVYVPSLIINPVSCSCVLLLSPPSSAYTFLLGPKSSQNTGWTHLHQTSQKSVNNSLPESWWQLFSGTGQERNADGLNHATRDHNNVSSASRNIIENCLGPFRTQGVERWHTV